MQRRPLIGASTGPGLAGLQVFSDLKLGNCVLADLPFDRAEAAAMMRFCRERRITIFLSELVYRGSKDLLRPAKRRMPREEFWSREELEAIVGEAGEYYGGRMTIGEAGGILYWPREYVAGEGVGAFRALPPGDTMLQAREAHVAYLRDFIDYEREEIGAGPLLDVDSSLVFRYHAEAGIDVLCHEALPGDPHRMQAALRGAARAYGKPWGTHIAMGWYGGVTVDPLWLRRWKSSVWHCYLTGSEFIYPESGHLALKEHQTGHLYEATSPEMRAARRTLREAYQFSLVHRRPAGGPRVRLGLVSGHGDGAPGLWNPWAWGQFHDPAWQAGPPEWGWELVDLLHRREDWPNYTVSGGCDWSGNPPDGQYDIVPVEASLEHLQGYSCLVFPGWHTMTEETYAKLKAYVEGGGRLLMFLPQLRADSVRGGEPQLLRDGDFADLFGVRIRGREATDVRGVKFIAPSALPEYRLPVADANCDPRFLGNFTPAVVELAGARVLAGYDQRFVGQAAQVAAHPLLVEHRVGAGTALLVTAWEYPADPALVGLTRELLRVVSAGEQGELRLQGSDRVRYAVYELPGGEGEVVYLLNTDPDVSAPVRLWVAGSLCGEITLPANEFALVYRFGSLLVQFSDRLVDLERTAAGEGRLEADWFVVNEQVAVAHNLGAGECVVALNGETVRVPAGGQQAVSLRRRARPDDPAFDPEFLQEPELQAEIDSRTAY